VVGERVLPALLGALLLVFSCAVEPASSVGYQVQWDRSLVSNSYQIPRALIRTSDGGYAVAGYGSVALVHGGVGAKTGFWTVKLDRDGNVRWQRAFAAEQPKRDEEGSTLTEARDGGLLVFGTTDSDSLAGRPMGETSYPRSPSTSQIGFVIKYSGDGNLLWKKALRTADDKPSDWFYAAAAVDGGYFVVGKAAVRYSDPTSPSGRNRAWTLRVVKIDERGDVVWDRLVPDDEFSIREESVSRKIAPTADGGLLVAIGPADDHYRNAKKMKIVSDAGEVIGEASFQQIVLFKLDREGRVVKRSEFPAATEHLAFGANASGYIVAGYGKLLWYAFFDNDLNLKWKKAVTRAMRIDSFYPAPDGGFYAAGSTSQLAIGHISPSGELRERTVSSMPGGSEGIDIAPGDRPDEFVVLWRRITRTVAGVIKLRVPVQ